MPTSETDTRVRQAPGGRPLELPSSAATPAVLAVHNNYCNAVRGLRRELVRTIYYLRTIFERKIHRAMGYRTIYEYTAQWGGLGEHQCKAFLRIGARLEELPAMKHALADGSLTWRKANLIVGEADRKNDQDLVNLAKELSAAELRNVLNETRPETRNTASRPLLPTAVPEVKPKQMRPTPPVMPSGATPAPARPATEPCYVTFKFTPEQYTVWAAFNARKKHLSKEEALVSSLGAGSGSNVSYVIVLQECPTCQRATLATSRGSFEAPRALLETARCDGTIEDADARRRPNISPRLRRMVTKRDQFTCQASGCTNTHGLQVHHRVPVSAGGRTALDNLVTLCARCHRALHDNEEALRHAGRDPLA